MSVFITHMYITFAVRHLDQYYKWTKFKCITLRRLLNRLLYFQQLDVGIGYVYDDDKFYTMCKLYIVIVTVSTSL